MTTRVRICNSSGIDIEVDESRQAFCGRVLTDYSKIQEFPTGIMLLRRLKRALAGIKTVLIQEDMNVTIAAAPMTRRRGAILGIDGLGASAAIAAIAQVRAADQRIADNTRSSGSCSSNDSNGLAAGPGIAVDSVIVRYDPINSRYDTTFPNPSWLVLAHELIHALHYLTGNKLDGHSVHGGQDVPNEELQTVGLGTTYSYQLTPGSLTENQLRLEAGLKIRYTYTGKPLEYLKSL